jgi:diguanylate cyclase (GGDEF)-like protein
MGVKTIVLFTILAFASGFCLAKALYWAFLALFVLLFVIAAFAYARRERHPVPLARGGPYDDPPDFVREETIEGETDTSMHALTPEYKRQIRFDIEHGILDSLNALLEVFKAAVPYHTAALFRRGKTDVVYLFLYHSESEDVLLGEAIPYGAGLVGQIMKDPEGRMICEGDIRAPSTTLLYYKKDEGIRSFLGVPVVVDGACRGAVAIDSKSAGAFDERAKRLMVLLARLAGHVQYYAYLQLENKIDRNKATALSSLQRRFFRLDTELEIIDNLGEILYALSPSARITVSLAGGKKGYAKIRYVSGLHADYFKDFEFPFSEKGLVSLVFEKNAMIKRRFEPSRYIPRFSVREKVNDTVKSILAVPVPSSSGEACMGVIALESPLANQYSQIDAENIQNLATATGLALEKIKMLDTQTHLATIDGLTGLPNHRHFQNFLDGRFKRARRQNSELAVILSDIDYFKKINDSHGHPAGDAILKGVSEIIQGSIRQYVDFAARYGGEEFACVLESGEKMAVETAERIRQQIEKVSFDLPGGKRIHVTMSFGVAVFPADASGKQLLIERADKALYEAKRDGRNRVKKY